MVIEGERDVEGVGERENDRHLDDRLTSRLTIPAPILTPHNHSLSSQSVLPRRRGSKKRDGEDSEEAQGEWAVLRERGSGIETTFTE